MSYSIQGLNDFIKQAKDVGFYSVSKTYKVVCSVKSVLDYVSIDDASLGQLDFGKVQQEYNSISGDKIKSGTKKVYFNVFLSTLKNYINCTDHPEKLVAKPAKKKASKTTEIKKTVEKTVSETTVKKPCVIKKISTEKPTITKSSTKITSVKKPRASLSKNVDQEASQNAIVSSDIQTLIFPIPIRNGVVVELHGLPTDLTNSEANKISTVINALVVGN